MKPYRKDAEIFCGKNLLYGGGDEVRTPAGAIDSDEDQQSGNHQFACQAFMFRGQGPGVR